MQIKILSFHKTIKKNLGHFNMLEAGFGMEIVPDAGEEIDRSKVWDEINREIDIQAGGTDPTWINQGDEAEKGKTYTR